MGECSNFECDNIAFGTKLICGLCKRLGNHTCTSCGTELNSMRAIRCNECTRFNHREVTYKSIKKRKNKRLNNTMTVN